MRRRRTFVDAEERWFVVDPRLAQARPVVETSDGFVRDSDPDVAWWGSEEEEDQRLVEIWTRVSRWAVDCGVDGIAAAGFEQRDHSMLAALGFAENGRARYADAREVRRLGPWWREGADEVARVLPRLIDIPMLTGVVYKGDVDRVWIQGDSWYSLLLNEPRGGDQLARYGL